jgi:hypothetical protein
LLLQRKIQKRIFYFIILAVMPEGVFLEEASADSQNQPALPLQAPDRRQH